MKKFNSQSKPRFSLRVGDIIGIPKSFGGLSSSTLRKRGISLGSSYARSRNHDYNFRVMLSDYTYDSMSWFVVTSRSHPYTSFVEVRQQSNNNRALEYDLTLNKLFIGFNKDKDRFEPVIGPADEKLSKKIIGSELSKILTCNEKASTQSETDEYLTRVLTDFSNYLTQQVGFSKRGYDLINGTVDRFHIKGVGLYMLKNLCFEHGRRFEKCYDKLGYFNDHYSALYLMLEISSDISEGEKLADFYHQVYRMTRYWTYLNTYPDATKRVADYLSSICNGQYKDEIYLPSSALPDDCVIVRPSEAGLAYLGKTMAKELKQQLSSSLKAHIEWTKDFIHPFNELINRLTLNKGKQDGKRND